MRKRAEVVRCPCRCSRRLDLSARLSSPCIRGSRTQETRIWVSQTRSSSTQKQPDPGALFSSTFPAALIRERQIQSSREGRNQRGREVGGSRREPRGEDGRTDGREIRRMEDAHAPGKEERRRKGGRPREICGGGESKGKEWKDEVKKKPSSSARRRQRRSPRPRHDHRLAPDSNSSVAPSLRSTHRSIDTKAGPRRASRTLPAAGRSPSIHIPCVRAMLGPTRAGPPPPPPRRRPRQRHAARADPSRPRRSSLGPVVNRDDSTLHSFIIIPMVLGESMISEQTAVSLSLSLPPGG